MTATAAVAVPTVVYVSGSCPVPLIAGVPLQEYLYDKPEGPEGVAVQVSIAPVLMVVAEAEQEAEKTEIGVHVPQLFRLPCSA